MAASSPEGIAPGTRYWASLDGIRGLFMALIFVFHAHPPFLPGAAILVDAFFVMSAFLITSLLLRESSRTGRLDLLRFYQRRALRLLPAIVIVLPVAAVLAYWLIPADRPEVVPALRSALLYYANFRAAHHQQGMSVFLPTWSLSTEEQFYVVWPTLMLVALRLRVPLRVLAVAVGGLLVVATVWLQQSFEHGTAVSVLVYRPDFRISGILVGTLLALLEGSGLISEQARPVTRALAALGVVYTAAFVLQPRLVPDRYLVTLSIVVACLFFAALVLQQVRWPVPAYSLVLENSLVLWLGRMAYVLYLVHVPALRLTDAVMGQPAWPVRMLVGGTVTVLVSAAVHEWAEKPALRLKARRGALLGSSGD